MITITKIPTPQKKSTPYTTRILSFSAALWLVVATVGQWLFGTYIMLFYGKSSLSGDFERWNKVLPHGYLPGDWIGNLVVIAHILLAVILIVGGPLQLIPWVRKNFPRFHQVLGRIYVVTAVVVSTTGLIMVWTRGAVGDTGQHVSISIQTIYIVGFALLAIYHARKRQMKQHREWALRLFMVVNGVWFFRVGLMCWILMHGGPVGFDPKTFSGPFLTALAVFTYAVPLSLIVLEMYFYAQQRATPAFRLFTAGLIILCTVLMAIGIVGATMGMWLPRL